MTIINDFNKIDKIKWNSFVNSHTSGTIFQNHQLFELFLDTPKITPYVFAALGTEKEILGILCAAVYKEYNGLFGKFTERAIIYGGPLVLNNDPIIAEKLLVEYNKSIKSKAIYSQFRNLFDTNIFKDLFLTHGFKFENHLDIHFDLTKSISDLENEIHKERKRNISRAVRKGVTFKELNDISDIDRAILLIRTTYKRIKLPLPDNLFFTKAIHYLGPHIKIFGALWENNLIACRIVLCYGETVYDWYAGSDFAFVNKYPNDFIPWEVILWAKKNGFKKFDFGGAGKPDKPYGVRDYKLKFGGNLVDYGRYELVHNLFMMELGKLLFRIYKKFNR